MINERSTRFEPRYVIRRFFERQNDYVHNPTPGISPQLSPVLQDVFDYHYDRKGEIVEGTRDFVEDKLRTKLLFGAATQYAKRYPGRLAAKVITRGIPYVGWTLLAYDAIQLYQWYQE